MGEQDVKPQVLDQSRIEEFRADLGREVNGAIAPDSAVWPMTYGFMRSLLATIDRLSAQLATARKGLEIGSKMCSFCHGSNRYTPHCYKCDDSGEDHVDCPATRDCPNEKCIEVRAALAAIKEKGAV